VYKNFLALVGVLVLSSFGAIWAQPNSKKPNGYTGDPIRDRVKTISTFIQAKDGKEKGVDIQRFDWTGEFGTSKNFDPATAKKTTQTSRYRIHKGIPLLIQQTLFGKTGEVNSKLRFEYDKAGRRILEEAHDGKNKFVYKRLWKFNAKGRLLEESYEDTYPSSSVAKITYNDKGWPRRRKVVMDEDGAKTESVTKYKTDKEGRVVEETTTISEFEETTVLVHRYDDKGRRVSSLLRVYRKGDKVKETLHSWKYNKKGTLQEATAGFGSTKETTSYKYDPKGRLIQIFHKGSDQGWIKKLKYD